MGGVVGPLVGLLVPASVAHETAPLGTAGSAERYAMPGVHVEREDADEVSTGPSADGHR
jgi:hypothetical protein